MKFVSKLLLSMFVVASTVLGSIWGGFEHLDSRMDNKVESSKVEIVSLIMTLRQERNALLKANDDKTAVQLTALNAQIVEVRKDVKSILGLTRRQVTHKKTREDLYSNVLLKENKL